MRVLRNMWWFAREHPLAAVAVSTLLVVAIVVAFAPSIAPYNPNRQNLVDRLQGPSRTHLLGTDLYGRDTFARLLHGTRTSILAAVQAVALAVLLGLPAGLVAGSQGGAVDFVIGRLFDLIMSLPGIILAIAIVGIFGPGLRNSMIAIGVVLAPNIYRVVRAIAQRQSSESYIEAARAAGLASRSVLVRHYLPGAMSGLAVQVTFALGTAVVAETSLSFLGFGVPAPTSSWGTMIRDGFSSIDKGMLPILVPAAAIFVVVLALSVFGDALSDGVAGRDEVGARDG